MDEIEIKNHYIRLIKLANIIMEKSLNMSKLYVDEYTHSTEINTLYLIITGCSAKLLRVKHNVSSDVDVRELMTINQLRELISLYIEDIAMIQEKHSYKYRKKRLQELYGQIKSKI